MGTDLTDRGQRIMGTDLTDRGQRIMGTDLTDRCQPIMGTDLTDSCQRIMGTDLTDRCQRIKERIGSCQRIRIVKVCMERIRTDYGNAWKLSTAYRGPRWGWRNDH